MRADWPDKAVLFGWIAEDRRRIADQLEGLDSAQLSTPSLCGDWTVEQCAAHLTAGMNSSWSQFGKEILKARGNFNKANDVIARQLADRGFARTIADLRNLADHPFTPPGAGPEAPLADIFAHSQDMFRPLGMDYPYDEARLRVILDMAIESRSRKLMNGPDLAGLGLATSDMDWSTGAGASVTGPGASMAHVLMGRSAGLADLSGEGVPTLQRRMV